ncbi:hypothetical protein LT330_009219 [Penicillium expansum]|nr:hypothetical protein LT330_009219 [Penicillium expansum]
MGHIVYPWAAETPKKYAPEFMTFANTTGKAKVMLGTNFPQLGWKECVDKRTNYLVGTKGDFRESVVKDYMGGNALQALKPPEMYLEGPQSNL